jgi:cytochrome c556
VGGLKLPAIALVLMVCAGSGATAQKPYPVFTVDDFLKFMKTVGQNFGAVNASIANGDFESAKSQLTRSREQLAVSVTFWRDRKKDDALKFLKDTLAKMDDLDAALSAEKIDPAAVGGLAKQVNAACEACHAVYRDLDPVTKAYRIRPGSIP